MDTSPPAPAPPPAPPGAGVDKNQNVRLIFKGREYIGPVKDGVPHGKGGKLTFENGNVWEG